MLRQQSVRLASMVPRQTMLLGLRMSQQTSAEQEPLFTLRTPEPAPLRQTATALDCLSRIAAHHGVELPVERLRHAYALDNSPITPALLLRMAKEAGLRARSTRLKWSNLLRLGEAYPALVPLANGNWIIVSGAGENADGEDVVSVIDPLAERRNEPLAVGKQPFCANWRGDVFLIKKTQVAAGSQRPFGFGWFGPE